MTHNLAFWSRSYEKHPVSTPVITLENIFTSFKISYFTLFDIFFIEISHIRKKTFLCVCLTIYIFTLSSAINRTFILWSRFAFILDLHLFIIVIFESIFMHQVTYLTLFLDRICNKSLNYFNTQNVSRKWLKIFTQNLTLIRFPRFIVVIFSGSV